MRSYRFAWVGGGQLSQTLLPALIAAGHSCVGWYLRPGAPAAPQLGGSGRRPQRHPDLSHSNCELLFLAVKDDALSSVAASLKVPEKSSCVHFSAAAALEVLAALRPRPCGMCYPLQAFARPLSPAQLRQVPFFIESNSSELEAQLKHVVSSLGAQAQLISSTARKQLHLAAVLSSNFSNHLLHHAKLQMEKAGLSFAYLRPLIEQSLRQSLDAGPEKSQSGPAYRGDSHTLATHEALLHKNPWLLQIYRLFSQDIRKTYPKKSTHPPLQDT